MRRKRFRSVSVLDFVKSQGIAIVLFLIIVAAILTGINRTSDVRSDEEMQMAEDSVRRAVVSCYAIEGRYPESYQYLKDNYGISIDDSKYIVHYEIFASNIMPEITITSTGR